MVQCKILLSSPLLSLKKGLICFLVHFQNNGKGERGSKVRPPIQVHELILTALHRRLMACWINETFSSLVHVNESLKASFH